ncbi:MAG: TIGR04283 family arsenosugar biosynthesis glycosyltransferase [Planctomycetota bacterium]|nr:TIGR04283 family arsenosugar biosynthesis glycosyltransferase [Planctomycetota bacterium]
MKVSVIIPALNEEASLARAARSAWKAGGDEVIVVDGGSADKTIEIAEVEGCHVIESTPGRAIQQNAGAAQAAGDVVLFLHADNVLSLPAIQQVRELLTNTETQFGAFKQQIDADGIAYRLLERGNAWRVRWLGLPYGDQAIFMRRGFFESLGRFPEVKLMEDLLLMKKARRNSWPRLLDGPVYIDARRWQRHGVARQTLRNWMLLTAYQLGWSPDSLASYYRRHDTA